MQITLAQARRFWSFRSGFGRDARDAVTACRTASWARTLGGVDAYVALRARAPNLTRPEVDAAVTRGALRVTPAVRGCMYLVPEDEAGLCLRLAGLLSAKRRLRDREKAGVDPAELPPLMEAVVDVLRGGPKTTSAMQKSLPDRLVRSLGAPGKKVGLSSTLPIALKDLEFVGRIQRVPPRGSLDSERYVWRIPTTEVLAGVPETSRAVVTAVVHRLLQRAGPLTVAELAAFTGAGKRDIKGALSSLDTACVAITDHAEEAWLMREDLGALQDAPASRALSFLAFEDSYVVLHGGPGTITDPRHHDVPVRAWGRGRPTPLGEAKHLSSRSILRGDELIGLWEYDPTARTIVWATFDPSDSAESARIDKAAAVAAAHLTGVGHARTFSLDKSSAVQMRADALREQGIAGAAVG